MSYSVIQALFTEWHVLEPYTPPKRIMMFLQKRALRKLVLLVSTACDLGIAPGAFHFAQRANFEMPADFRKRNFFATLERAFDRVAIAIFNAMHFHFIEWDRRAATLFARDPALGAFVEGVAFYVLRL